MVEPTDNQDATIHCESLSKKRNNNDVIKGSLQKKSKFYFINTYLQKLMYPVKTQNYKLIQRPLTDVI